VTVHGILILAGAVGFLAYFFIFGISHFKDFRIDEDGIAIIVFGGRSTVFEYENIESARITQWPSFDYEGWGLRDVFTSRYIGCRPTLTTVRLTMKKGFSRYITITPANPVVFAEEVNRRIKALDHHS